MSSVVIAVVLILHEVEIQVASVGLLVALINFVKKIVVRYLQKIHNNSFIVCNKR